MEGIQSHLGLLTGGMASFRREAGLLGIGLATGVAAFFGIAVHSAMEYQDALSTVQVNAHLTADAADAMGKAISETAVGTTSSATDMVRAIGPVAGELSRVTGATITQTDAQNLLSASQNLVASSGAELGSTVKSLTDLMLVYHEKTADAATISDTLFQAHTLLGIGTDRLAMMLQRLQPRIAGSGVDMQHLLGIVLEMTPAVGSGTRAMMMVGNILQTLVSPSAAAKKALEALGISLVDQNGKFIGFGAALDKIKSSYDQLPASAAHTAAGIRLAADQTRLATLSTENQTKAVKAHEDALKKDIAALNLHGADLDKNALLQALFGRNANIAAGLVEGGAAGIQDATNALTGQGTAAQAAAIKNKDLGSMITIIKQDIDDAVTVIGTALIPVLTNLLGWVTPTIEAFTRWAQANPDLIATVLAIAGAIGALVAGSLLLGPILAGLGTVMEFVGSPILVVVGAFFLLTKVLSGMPDVLKPLQPLFDALGNAAALVGPALGTLFGALSDFIAGRGSIEAIGSALGNLGTALGQALSGVLGALGDIAGKIVAWATSMIPIWAAAIEKWAGAFIAWIAPLIPQFLDALAGFAVQAFNWVAQQVPLLAKQLLDWAGAFVAWIAPMAAEALTALGNWLGDTLAWIAAQLPTIAAAVTNWITATATTLVDDLVAWTTAFVSWIAPIAAQALTVLGQWASDLLAWIAAQVPAIAAQLVKWAGAFVDWAVSAALTVVGKLNDVINAVTNWITSTTTIKDITTALVDWVAPFLAWAGEAAVKAIGALVVGIGVEIVKEGPSIALAVVSGGIQIAEGLAQGLISHPEAILGAIGIVLAGAAVLGAIKLAAQAASAAYAQAMEIGQAIADAVSAAWDEIDGSVAKIAGALAGVAYTTAMEIAETVEEALSEIWDNVKDSTAIKAAVAVAGAITAPIYAAGAAAFGPIKEALLAMWAIITPVESAAAAASGAEVGFARGAALAGGEREGYFASGGGLEMNLGPLGAGAGDDVKRFGEDAAAGATGTAAFSGALGYLATLAVVVGGPLALLQNQIDNVNKSMSETPQQQFQDAISANPLDFGPLKIGTWLGIGKPPPPQPTPTPQPTQGVLTAAEQAQIVPNINEQPYHGSAMDLWMTDAVTSATRAHDQIVAQMAKVPGDVENALTSNQTAIDNAVNGLLGTFTTSWDKQGNEVKTYVSTSAALIAEGFPQAFQNAHPELVRAGDLIAADLKKPITSLSDREAYLKAQLVIAQYQLGAAQQGNDPVGEAKAAAAITNIENQMTALQNAAEAYGKNTISAYQLGMDSVPAKHPISLTKLAAILAASSPPGPDSPLHEIDTWGANTMQAFYDGMASTEVTATNMITDMLNRMVTALRAGIAQLAAVWGQMHTVLSGSATDWGYNLIANFANGIKSGVPLITGAVTVAASKVAALLKLASPAEEGPLSLAGGPEGWGARFDELMAKGMLNGQIAVAAANIANSLAQPFNAPDLAGLAAGGSTSNLGVGGPGTTHIHVYIGDQEVHDLVTKVMFEEERRHAGPAVAGSSF